MCFEAINSGGITRLINQHLGQELWVLVSKEIPRCPEGFLWVTAGKITGGVPTETQTIFKVLSRDNGNNSCPSWWPCPRGGEGSEFKQD